MSNIIFNDEYFMKQALMEAKTAYDEGEVPVGAVVVCNNKIISKAHNLTEKLNDVTAHAEILAITSATQTLGGKYLNDCTLYVTLEPCAMCAGALAWSQIDRIVFGASDTKGGFSRHKPTIIHPKTTISSGVMQNECSKIVVDFFKEKR